MPIGLTDYVKPKNDAFTGIVQASQVLGGGGDGTLPDATVASSNVTQHEGDITHGNLGGLTTDPNPHEANLTDLDDVSGETGTGDVVRATEPTFGTRIIVPQIKNTGDILLEAYNGVARSFIFMRNSGFSLLTVITQGDLTVVGDVTVTGIVDGRDIADDGTKLDTIEESADVTDATNVDAAGAVMEADVDAKGDLLAATADNAVSRLAVGSNDQVLTADSAETTGLKWAAAAGGGVDTSGTPIANDIARFTDADTIEGRSYAELRADLQLQQAGVFTLEDPVAVGYYKIAKIPYTGILARVNYKHIGGTNVEFNLYVNTEDQINGGGTIVWSGNKTTTTSSVAITSFTANAMTQYFNLWVKIITVTGTVTEFYLDWVLKET